MITLLTLELIIKSFLISWMIINFTPFQIYVVGVLEGINEGLFSKRPFIYTMYGMLMKPLNCMKCSSFWTGLILSQGSIFIGISTGILGYHYDKWNSKQGIKLW